MKVAIIGAGLAGLISARKASQYNLECTVFETTGNLGGTWVYTENASADEFNNPVCSSLFASTRTNVPTQTMELEGLEFKPKSGLSFPHHEEVLEYVQGYAKTFQLHKYIRFYHKVLRVSRETNVWKLTVKDLKQNTSTNHLFDAVVIATGRFSKPKLPEIRGMETFSGDQIHSHYYRRKDQYKNRRLLVVGAAPSGMDISTECLEVAQKVYLSYRTAPPKGMDKNIEIRGLISFIDGRKIHFEDGTDIYVDSIIYCTGYEYDASILDPSCGIEILAYEIYKPLYKMYINSNEPTMAILGLIKKTSMIQIYNLQAEIFMKHLSGVIDLPSTEEMVQSFYDEYDKNSNKGLYYYDLFLDTEKYYNDLAQLGNLKPLKLALWRLWLHLMKCKAKDFNTFRNNSVRIIDDENFEFIQIDETQKETGAINECAEIKTSEL